MSSKRKLTCPLPDGTVATRTTARTYSHVLAFSTTGECWSAVAWAGRLDLAYNQRGRWAHLANGHPDGRLAIIEIETGEVIWSGKPQTSLERLIGKPAPVAKPEPAPVPSAPREPKPSQLFKTPDDIRSFVGLGLQPALVHALGRRGAVQRVAEALVAHDVSQRRIHNAIQDDLLAVEILTAMSMITINS